MGNWDVCFCVMPWRGDVSVSFFGGFGVFLCLRECVGEENGELKFGWSDGGSRGFVYWGFTSVMTDVC